MIHDMFLSKERITTKPRWIEQWFWDEHVLTMTIGQSVQTDFRTITRIA